jgi:surface protein
MFYSCSSLKFIPDISKWDTTNVKDLSHMFHGCSSITSLPDISEWNTCNNRDLSYMFHGCSSLKSLPNISNWNIKNVISFKNLISDCHSLSDISTLKNWNLNIDTEINKGDGLELKYELKDDNLKFLPQLEIKFNNVNIIEKNIISKIKLEIQKLIEKKKFFYY